MSPKDSEPCRGETSPLFGKQNSDPIRPHPSHHSRATPTRPYFCHSPCSRAKNPPLTHPWSKYAHSGRELVHPRRTFSAQKNRDCALLSRACRAAVSTKADPRAILSQNRKLSRFDHPRELSFLSLATYARRPASKSCISYHASRITFPGSCNQHRSSSHRADRFSLLHESTAHNTIILGTAPFICQTQTQNTIIPGNRYWLLSNAFVKQCSMIRPKVKNRIRGDVFTKEKRSAVMSAIRSKGNKETEIVLAATMRKHRIGGWRRHLTLPGKPDFAFPKKKLAVFVDGCFWHSCPKHGRQPNSNSSYWIPKLVRNKARDRNVNRLLKSKGWKILRIWEHDLRREAHIILRIRNALSA